MQNKNAAGALKQPVVVVLGHVDHGKSSLLEAIRDFKITQRESGGITQHIGAYEVEHEGKKITFLDTPGHEAFSQMRSRGAKVADIALLVVAADDGVKPQTKEAISLVNGTDLAPIVVLSKTDKPGAQQDKVKNELASHEMTVESWGGTVPSVEVSSKTKQGIPELLELILLVTEMKNVSSDTDAPFEGTVIESFLDPKRGPTATVISSRGVLETGSVVGTDSSFGKVRILEDFMRKPVSRIFPGQSAVLVGLSSVPLVGEVIVERASIEEAQENMRGREQKKEGASPDSEKKEKYEFILKADVAGSLEAAEATLAAIPQEEVALHAVASSVGNISVNDVKLAEQNKADILGFRVKKDQGVVQLAERAGVRIKEFDVIYHLEEHVREEAERRKRKDETRQEQGAVKIAALFSQKGSSQVVGGSVERGVVRKGDQVEVMRGEESMGRGKIRGLKKFQTEASEIKEGQECGILYEGNVQLEKGDLLVSYGQES